ncbi:glycosyltransferase [Liquorilactobacillus oeni DSM 19972]|uniref:Glycosyltransferase n=2 Tax=Liquorilactobacillus oeni TaxID=303241 RepID=A0A0R1M8A7_9LACO|nr:glycosyltransferase [Liquorilactobacillus oeni DSM 19972]
MISMSSPKTYILQIGMNPNPGGLEAFVMNLYRKIDRTQVQFDFIDWYGEERIAFSEEILQLGGQIIKIPSRREDFMLNKRKLKKIINSEKYRYVYNNLNSLSYISGITATYKNPAVIPIIHAHNDNIENRLWLTKMLDTLHKTRINNEKGVRLACSKKAGLWMFAQRRFQVVPDAIDTLTFKYSPQKRKLYRKQFNLENKLVLGNVARFDPQKNHLFLIDIFKHIHEKKKESMLILVGDGRQLAEAKEHVTNLGLKDNVLFPGVRKDVPGILQALDVMVAPSVFEGFGISVLEAQCAGLPCYVSEVFHPEALQTPLTKIISLNAGPKQWAEQILADYKAGITDERMSFANLIKSNGYDSGQLARQMQQAFVNGF